uniref:ER membrane protein complex subunit 4 n=1 Tax=Arcella intermedia TaxID=1963864 RepID=A0A6B2LPR2_9EUKA
MKKAWEIASSPFSMIVMYGIFFWLTPNSPNIFTIAFPVYALFVPIKAIFSINQTFQGVENPKKSDLLPYKMMFGAIQVLFVGLALWKISKMGLLPVNDADWVIFYRVREAAEFVGKGSIL